MSSTLVDDPRVAPKGTSRGRLDDWRQRLARADLGSLPVIIGLVFIWFVFQLANDKFLSPVNLTNLMLQIAAMGTISVGVVVVLLLGEIDLSVGAVSGLCAAIVAVLNVKNGQSGQVAVLAGLASGLLIGILQGLWITKLRVPSFIVTLAGFLGWQGALLLVLGETGSVNLRNGFILGLAGTFFPRPVGWGVAAAVVVIYLVALSWERYRRRRASLSVAPLYTSVAKAIVIAVGVFGAMAVLNADRGLPSAVVFFVGIMVVFDFITKRTAFGRHVFAVGGHAEAARRASINVDLIRMSAFAISSLLAAMGGILAASRLLAVNQSSGSGDLLLNSIASAVIGGTSLFGGRGSVWSALLGALIIGSISNGMDLLAFPSSTKFMITGAVLLAAVTLDALARRRREAAGR